MLSDRKILITGATGQIGRPIAERLIGDNEGWCAARFSDPALKRQLEDLGVKTRTATSSSARARSRGATACAVRWRVTFPTRSRPDKLTS